MVMSTKEILATVTGPDGQDAPTLPAWGGLGVDDAVTGRGDLIGRVVDLVAEGDVKVRWEDGEEWVYPPSFLTLVNKGPLDTEAPMLPPPMDEVDPLELGSYYFPEDPATLSPLPPVLDPRLATEVRHTDETTGAQKGIKAERFDLLPWDALEEVARVYAYGAKKYADRNWEKGYPWGWSFQALIRHASRWMCGETYDKETGLHHMAHACFHCLALVTYAIREVGKDDRPW